MRWKSWPSWVKGLTITLAIELGLVVMSTLLIIIGFGLDIPVVAKAGFFLVLFIGYIVVYVGGTVIEFGNYFLALNIPLTSGGGSPSILTQVISFVVVTILGSAIGWIIGKIKK